MTETPEQKQKREVKKCFNTYSPHFLCTITFNNEVPPEEVHQFFSKIRKGVSEHYKKETPLIWWLRRLRTNFGEVYPCIQIFSDVELCKNKLKSLMKKYETSEDIHKIQTKDWSVELQERFLSNKEMFNSQIFKEFFNCEKSTRFAITNKEMLVIKEHLDLF